MSGLRRTAGGFTLIELVMAIVIISIALTGILLVMNENAARSADPMIRTQAHGVAQAYLEEILLQAYADPDGSDAGETRPSFDDVDDYDGLASNGCTAATPACPLGSCACDQLGNPIAALADYQVSVSVVPATLNGVPAKRITVTVSNSRAPGISASLTGYRTEY